MDFASILKTERLAKGLTLQKLADKVGTEKGYISGAENRKVNPPSPKIVRRMAKVLGLDVTELLVYSFVPKAPKEIREILLDGALAILTTRKLDKLTEPVPVA